MATPIVARAIRIDGPIMPDRLARLGVNVGGDSLWALAAKEYDDPTQWVRIAEANDLDDPREIAAGDWITVPPIENPDGTGSAV